MEASTEPLLSSPGVDRAVVSLAAPNNPPERPLTPQLLLNLQQTRGNQFVLRTLAAQGRLQARRQATATHPTLQRAWSDAPTSGAISSATSGTGATATPVTAPAAGWNSGEVAVGAMRRIPVEGLSGGNQTEAPEAAATNQSAVGRAVVIIPAGVTISPPPSPPPQIEILLFLHGHNIGYRQRTRRGKVSGSEVGTVRDVELDQLEQQLQAVNSPTRIVIGVLPQGTSHSGFGALSGDPYLNEVLAKLNTDLVWGPGVQGPTSPSRVILAGHSGAGDPISAMLASGAGSHSRLSATLAEVILFDAINGPVELERVQHWVSGSLSTDLRRLRQIDSDGQADGHDATTIEADKLAYLQTSMRFRGYHTNSDYAARYAEVNNTIQGWFNTNARSLGGSSSAVYRQLRDNYKVEPAVPRDHEHIVGAGGVKDSLQNLPPLPPPAATASAAVPSSIATPPAAAPDTSAPDAGVPDASLPGGLADDASTVSRFPNPSGTRVAHEPAAGRHGEQGARQCV